MDTNNPLNKLGDHQLSQSELTAAGETDLAQNFTPLDTNKDNLLSTAELAKGGVGITEKDYNDQGLAGTTVGANAASYAGIFEGNAYNQGLKAKDAKDINQQGDGFLTLDEITKSGTVGSYQLQGQFKDLDVNKDNKLSIEEFKAAKLDQAPLAMDVPATQSASAPTAGTPTAGAPTASEPATDGTIGANAAAYAGYFEGDAYKNGIKATNDDKQGDGFLTKNEITSSKVVGSSQLLSQYESLDTNHDGKLNAAELSKGKLDAPPEHGAGTAAMAAAGAPTAGTPTAGTPTAGAPTASEPATDGTIGANAAAYAGYFEADAYKNGFKATNDDKQGDGFLTKNEITNSKVVGSSQLLSQYESLDTNHDGKLNAAELSKGKLDAPPEHGAGTAAMTASIAPVQATAPDGTPLISDAVGAKPLQPVPDGQPNAGFLAYIPAGGTESDIRYARPLGSQKGPQGQQKYAFPSSIRPGDFEIGYVGSDPTNDASVIVFDDTATEAQDKAVRGTADISLYANLTDEQISQVLNGSTDSGDQTTVRSLLDHLDGNDDGIVTKDAWTKAASGTDPSIVNAFTAHPEMVAKIAAIAKKNLDRMAYVDQHLTFADALRVLTDSKSQSAIKSGSENSAGGINWEDLEAVATGRSALAGVSDPDALRNAATKVLYSVVPQSLADHYNGNHLADNEYGTRNGGVTLFAILDNISSSNDGNGDFGEGNFDDLLDEVGRENL